jgi:4-hydroxy-tetrahydrodipicolinate reductase
VGRTGWYAELPEIEKLALAKGVPIFVAPNFAIGAALLMKFAQQAAQYLDHAEIIELHHDRKVDAPSGTAEWTARLIVESRRERPLTAARTEKFTVPGVRGGDRDGVVIHSVRLPGFVAHQEVIFGGTGQVLTLRHDSLDRTSFMPGVLHACKRVRSLSGLTVGLEQIL